VLRASPGKGNRAEMQERVTTIRDVVDFYDSSQNSRSFDQGM
jgi:hypothetical protein